MKKRSNITNNGGVSIKIHDFGDIWEEFGENKASKIGKVGVEFVVVGTVVGVDKIGEIVDGGNGFERDEIGLIVGEGFFSYVVDVNGRGSMAKKRFDRGFNSSFVIFVRSIYNMNFFFFGGFFGISYEGGEAEGF